MKDEPGFTDPARLAAHPTTPRLQRVGDGCRCCKKPLRAIQSKDPLLYPIIGCIECDMTPAPVVP